MMWLYNQFRNLCNDNGNMSESMGLRKEYIPRNMHAVRVLLCFIIVR